MLKFKSVYIASAHLMVGLFVFFAGISGTHAEKAFRPPAVPLVTIDPYTSTWSFSDHLFDESTKHWTAKPRSMTGIIRVDGLSYRFMGGRAVPSTSLLPTAKESEYESTYTTRAPTLDWMKPEYQDSAWEHARGDLGNQTYNLTKWDTPDVWVRREFSLNTAQSQNLILNVLHNEDIEVYLNGTEIYRCAKCITYSYESIPLPENAKKALRKGRNVLSVHCYNSGGAGFIDAGLSVETEGVAQQTAKQTEVTVKGTQTHYRFLAGTVNLNLTFSTPLLMNDLDTLSRPVTYLTFQLSSADGKKHSAQVYFDASAEWAVDSPKQMVSWQQGKSAKLNWLRVGSTEQPTLQKTGDDRRIDWGYFYIGVPIQSAFHSALVEQNNAWLRFHQSGQLDDSQVSGKPRADNLAADRAPVLAAVGDFQVGVEPVLSHLLIGYDDLFSLQYFGKNLRPWWHRDEAMSFASMFDQSETLYGKLMARSARFDRALHEEARQAGGEEYAKLCDLAYRQAIAAHKLVVGPNQQPWFFSKENFSNGSIGTVDVTYPSAPLFLRYNPALLRGMLDFIFDYSESGRWAKPFPAHDVGTYPLANGQTYPEDMPVEEAGNMLIMTAAIAQAEGHSQYAVQHWETLTTWERYLENAGIDPENQLCTDDFAGHLTHNANLSIKAILGLAAYAKLANDLGELKTADRVRKIADAGALSWVQLATDGNHTALTLNDKGTWSQKYNLIWDTLLGLHLFPKQVIRDELNWYASKQNLYGVPLDSRKTYTKSDWTLWSASLSDSKSQFRQFVSPLYRYANETESRMPISDWHDTLTGKAEGFRARSVVGGYFMKVLKDRWKIGLGDLN